MISVSVLVLLAFAVPPKVSAMPMPFVPDDLATRRPQTIDDRIDYLIRYGYITVESNQMSDDQVLSKAIANLQRFGGIPVTGKMDEATDTLMATPRCGLPDDLTTTRRKRFVVQGSKWRQQQMTYLFQNYTSKLSTDVTKKTIMTALQLWSEVSPLYFAEAAPGAKTADIKLRFARRYHGDSGAFDGPGGVLAHAYFPSSGATHFDEDEPWTNGVKSGVNLLQVATHELGHALGLGHSKSSKAVMAPFYKGYDPMFALNQDDIDGIQAIYGKPQKSKSKPEIPLGSVPTSPSSSKSPASSTTKAEVTGHLSSKVPTTTFPTTPTTTTTKSMPTLTHITTTTTSSSSSATHSPSSSTTSTISTTFPTMTNRDKAVPTRTSPIISERTTAVKSMTTLPLMRHSVRSIWTTFPFARTTVRRRFVRG